jgi:dihydrofolate reductase
MGRVYVDMSMSLDGFVSGLNNDDAGLHNWYFNPSPVDKDVIDELKDTVGAIVMGRRSYQMGDDYDGYADNPYSHVPHLVLTHQPPSPLPTGDTTFIFVTDGIENLIRQAQVAAGDKDVVIGGGANLVQQLLQAGLLDEIQIHLVPVIIGAGIRLFDNIETPMTLEKTQTIEGMGVTHFTYRVVK